MHINCFLLAQGLTQTEPGSQFNANAVGVHAIKGPFPIQLDVPYYLLLSRASSLAAASVDVIFHLIDADGHPTGKGMSIFLTQGSGAHMFTVWPDGTAFWSKHNAIGDSKATQQFRGTCVNIRNTE